MNIRYGLANNNIDITFLCLTKLKFGNNVIIRSDDCKRALIFSDPFPNILKSIFITIDSITTEYDHTQNIQIDIVSKSVSVFKNPDVRLPEEAVSEKINQLHSVLRLHHGSFRDELPEQKMAVRYLKGNEKILEIGGNIGRNSLIISKVLGDLAKTNMIVMECDQGISNQLKENRDLNGMNFQIETAALSKRNLIQKGWDTVVSDVLLPGYKPVNTIVYSDLIKKYNIDFDTLVLDCEGAFYYILQDMPEILDGITLIIMENDYHNRDHKQYIDTVMCFKGFYVDYSEAGGWGPCYSKFFEVWRKVSI